MITCPFKIEALMIKYGLLRENTIVNNCQCREDCALYRKDNYIQNCGRFIDSSSKTIIKESLKEKDININMSCSPECSGFSGIE